MNNTVTVTAFKTCPIPTAYWIVHTRDLGGDENFYGYGHVISPWLATTL